MYNAVVFSKSGASKTEKPSNVLAWLDDDGLPTGEVVLLELDHILAYDTIMLVHASKLDDGDGDYQHVFVSGPASIHGVQENGDSTTVMWIVSSGKFPAVVQHLYKSAVKQHVK